MPKSALSSLEVLRILNAAIGAKDCVYFTERDQTITVQFTYENELFTVAGVMRSELADRRAVNVLGTCLLAEANSMLGQNKLDLTFEGNPAFYRLAW